MNEWFDAEDHVERAHELFEAGRWVEAEKELREALARNPYQAEWHFNLGLTLQAAQRFREASESFKHAFEHGTGDGQTALLVAINALRAGDPQGALCWLDKAHALDDSTTEALVYRIEALTQLGEHEQAELTFYMAQQIDPDDAELYATMAESLLLRKKYDKAAWCLREAARLDPQLPRVEARLAFAYAQTGRLERARQLYIRELRREPGNIDTLLDLGELLLEMNRDSEASEKFRRVLELEPDNADAHYNLGRLARKAGDTVAALRQFDLVVRLDPTYPRARCQLANELLASKSAQQITRARTLLREELREQSDRFGRTTPEEMNELGQLLLDASLPTEAGLVFKRLIALEPGNADAYHAMSVSCFFRGQRELGMEYARKAHELDPLAIAPMHNLAMAYLEAGQWTRARYWASRARHLAPDDPSLRRLRLKLRVQAVVEVVRWFCRKLTRQSRSSNQAPAEQP